VRGIAGDSEKREKEGKRKREREREMKGPCVILRVVGRR
jgi:hypothetical protein